MTKNDYKVNKEAIKTGAKIVGRTLLAVGKVVGTVVVTTIEILHDVVTVLSTDGRMINTL